MTELGTTASDIGSNRLKLTLFEYFIRQRLNLLRDVWHTGTKNSEPDYHISVSISKWIVTKCYDRKQRIHLSSILLREKRVLEKRAKPSRYSQAFKGTYWNTSTSALIHKFRTIDILYKTLWFTRFSTYWCNQHIDPQIKFSACRDKMYKNYLSNIIYTYKASIKHTSSCSQFLSISSFC